MTGGRGVRASVVVVVVGVLAACAPGSKQAPTPSTGQLPRGGALVVGEPGLYGYTDPQDDISDYALALGRCCLLRTLLSYNGLSTSDGGGVLRPDLASTLPSISPDGLTWTFRLRRGLRYAPPFQNQEIVAGDFVRSMEREVTLKHDYGGGIEIFYTTDIEGAAAYAAGKATSISGMQAADDHTLVIHTTKPVGDLGYTLALAVTAPIPPSPTDPNTPEGAALGHDGDYGSFMAASGPYMIEGAGAVDPTRPPAEQQPATGVRKDSLTLVRNPSWHEETDPLRGAYVDRIVIRPAPDDPGAAAAKVLSGAFDLIYDPSSYLDLRELTAPFERSADLRDRVLLNPNGFMTLTMNMALPPFDDLHVRRAVQAVIDRDELAALWERNGRLVVPATHLGQDSTEDNLLLNYQPFGGPGGDLDAAKQEMRQSGDDANGDGVCDASACRGVVALVRKDPPRFVDLAADVRKDLAAIGIGLDVTPLDADPLFARIFDPRTHTGMTIGVNWQAFYPSASNTLPTFLAGDSILTQGGNLSLAGATPAQLRRWGYAVTSVPSVDARVDQCVPLSFDAATRCWAELDQYAMERLSADVPLLTNETATVVSARVEHVSFDQSTYLPALDQIALKGG
ncbi:MAG TPA: ABC transporter substrate-binding protein [Actinomycetota bacterium]|nr:ABC transporter substrate-binding protein [Actinomycetota bacterium]